MADIQVRGSSVFYKQIGLGSKPVICVHGFGNTGNLWIPFCLPFLGSHRFYLIDLPGFGQSKRFPVNEDLLETYGECIQAVIDTQTLNQPKLAGFSLGAYACLAYLSSRKSPSISKYLHIDHPPLTQNRDDWSGGVDEGLLQDFADLCKKSETEQANATLTEDLSPTMYDAYVKVMESIGTKSLSHEFTKQLNHWVHRTPVVRFLSTSRAEWPWAYQTFKHYVRGTYDLRSQLNSISCPVTLVHGGHSRICNRTAAEFMKSTIPKSTLVSFDHSAHDLMLREPIKFGLTFRQFLKTP